MDPILALLSFLKVSKDNFMVPTLQIPPSPFLRSASDLLCLLGLPVGEEMADFGFSTLVTTHFVSKMIPGNARDPLLLQVLPADFEGRQVAGFCTDPVGDGNAQQDAGILQKYSGRILVVATGACAIHCRYCFRRSYPYADIHSTDIAERLELYLHAHPDVEEVILSGGDPLLLSDETLARLFAVTSSAPSVTRIRIHTRLPVVLPTRFSSSLLNLLAEQAIPIVLVAHVNHAQELDSASAEVFAALRAIGVHLLNQSVLLQGVNDSLETLAELSRRLFAQGVMPYYLHQLDRVAGAAHFEVPESVGLALVAQLQAILPGYLVPKYVREIPGEPCKTLL